MIRCARAALCALALALAGCAGAPQIDAGSALARQSSRVELEATPFFPQDEYQCGPAALATALAASGLGVRPEELVAEVYLPGRQGSLQPELTAAARSRGRLPYELPPSLDTLLAQVESGRPVLVLQKQGLGPWPAWHYAVVVGYDLVARKVVLRSGKQRRATESLDLFDATWSRAGRWALVLLAPGELPAEPDLGRYMSAAASLESVGRPDDALQSYRAAADQWPAAALPLLGQANVAAARGDWVSAERDFGRAARLDPANAGALNNHATALLELGCPAAARRQVERARVAAGQGPLARAVDATARDIAAATSPDAPGCPPVAPD